MPDLGELVRAAVEAAKGDEAVEAYAEESRQTEASALRGEVEGLEFAESRGVGVRVIRDGRLGYAYAADASVDEVRATVGRARENATLTEPESSSCWSVPPGPLATSSTFPAPGLPARIANWRGADGSEGEAMSEERVRQIVRQFPENGLKQVLTSPGNVKDLLALVI